MQLSICQICKDPIWSFICPHCLARDISKWLPNKLKKPFRKFNETFFNSFSATIDIDGLRCLKCKKIRLANICPFCYLSEVYEWLRFKNNRLAMTILSSIPLAHDWTFKGDSGVIWKSGHVPISESERNMTEEGTCEICESYSDELFHEDGDWVCRDCRRNWRIGVTGV